MPEDEDRVGPDRRPQDQQPQQPRDQQPRGAPQRPVASAVGTDDWWAARAAQAGGGLPPEDTGWLVQQPEAGGVVHGPPEQTAAAVETAGRDAPAATTAGPAAPEAGEGAQVTDPAAPPARPSGLTGRRVGVVSGMAARPPLPSTRAARRRSTHPAGVSAGRAVAGAAVAVVGVALGIGALLWASDDPTSGTPTVQALISGPEGPTATATASADAPVVMPHPPTASRPAAVRGTAPVAVAPVPRPSPSPSRPAQPSPPIAKGGPANASRGPAALSLTVLNNSRYGGLAARAASRFRSGGYPVGEVGNFTGRIRTTTVYYAPGSARQAAAARALAGRFPGVHRVLPRFAGLPGSGLTVVVTRDFRA